MKEIWRKVEGYDNPYEVSNLGRIKRLSFTKTIHRGGKTYVAKFKEKYLGLTLNADGYKVVYLMLNNKDVGKGIHIIVAKAFLPNPENLPEVNHKNSNKSCNYTDNLEWVTHRENCTHRSLRMNTSSEYNGVCWDKRRNKWVAHITIKSKFKFLGYFISERAAALAHIRYLNIHKIDNKFLIQKSA